MTERVDIANMALTWLGEQEITSLDDDSDRARAIRISYLPARDATLEAHDWSFAMMRFIPGQVEADPVYGATFAFKVPAEILRVVSVDRSDTFANAALRAPISSLEQIDWVIEDGLILCNEEVIYCRGVREINQEGKFSPLFVQAFAAKLAWQCAIAITASSDIKNHMKDMYMDFIQEAKTRDGLQGRSRRIRNRSLIKSR